MSVSTNNTPSNQAATNPPASGYVDPNATPPVVDPVDPPKDNVDDFGYDTPKDPPKDPVDPPKDPPKEEVIDPATGYKKDVSKDPVDPPKDPPKDPVVDPVDPPVSEEDLKKQFDAVLGDHPSKDLISKFAIDNKMTKEQVENYATLIKAEDAQVVKNQEAQVKATRDGWDKELREDKDFGGENFPKSLDRVEKLMAEFMPNTKKALTDNGGMLPPYFMRDLLSLSQALNPTTELVGGQPPKPVVEEKNFLDEMYG